MPPSIISRARTAIAKAIAPAHVARPSYPNLAAPRRYPDYNTARSSILGTEHNMGRSGLKYFYPGWIRNEPLSELQGAAKYLVFKEMGDMNGYCAAALNAFAMFLRRAKWRVDPVLDENKTNGSAQFLEECMEDMEHSWSTFIAQASRTVPQMGFCPFEIVYKLRNGENEDDPRLESKHDDGKIGWQTFAIRSPETVFHWVWYPDDPTRLRGLVQLTPPDYPSDLFIPVEKILLLRAEPGEDNPEGRSILRSSYKPFIVIRFMEDARNIIIEHAGTGIPKAELPPSITNPYSVDPVTGQPVLDDAGNPVVDPVSLATLNSVKESLMNMRLNEEPYIIVPSQFDENGHKLFDISFMTNNGGSMIGEINNTIKEEGMKILMSCMAEFLALGTNATGGGSFALSRDKTDNFSLAITSLLDLFQESINNQAVKRLFKLNPEFDLEVLPRIVHDPIVPININEVAAVLSGFKGIGWDLTKEANSEEIKNAILEAVGLPKAAKKDEANAEGENKATPGKETPPAESDQPSIEEGTGGPFGWGPRLGGTPGQELKKYRCKENPPGSGNFECPKKGKTKDKGLEGGSISAPSKPGKTESTSPVLNSLGKKTITIDDESFKADVYEYRGIHIHMEALPKSKVHGYTKEAVTRCIDKLPSGVASKIKTINIRAGPSKGDELASKTYGFKMVSAGTADYLEGAISLFQNPERVADKPFFDVYEKKLLPLLAHESGHLVDGVDHVDKHGHPFRFSYSQKYQDAFQKDLNSETKIYGKTIKKKDVFGGFVSEYAQNTHKNNPELGMCEDFADTFKEYVRHKMGQSDYAPLLSNRFKAIDELLGGG